MTLARFKILARKISDYYDYTEEDKDDLWEAYKIDPKGILNALDDQYSNIGAEVALKISPPRKI